MCNDPFYHKDSKVSAAMRCLLGILRQDDLQIDDPQVPAQQSLVGRFARLAVDKLYDPAKIDKTPSKRPVKMVKAIEIAISRGFVEYSGSERRLSITRRGRQMLERRHKAALRRSGKQLTLSTT